MAFSFLQPATSAGKTQAQIDAENAAIAAQAAKTVTQPEQLLSSKTAAQKQAEWQQLQAAVQAPTPTVAPVTTPARTATIPAPITAPTPTQPIKPVSATGTPMIFAGQAPAPTTPTSQFVPTTPAPQIDLTKPAFQPIQPVGQIDLSQYENLTPEQKLAVQAQAYQMGGQMQMENLQRSFDLQKQLLGEQQAQAEAQAKAKEEALMAQRATDVAAYEADVKAQQAQAEEALKRQGAEATAKVQEQMAFTGFGRSTKAAELVGQVQEQTTQQIGNIERESNRAIREYQAATLDKVNAQVDVLKQRVQQFGDAKDSLELQRVQKQGELLTSLYEQNPLNPVKMIEAADKLATQKAADLKAIKDEAATNFKFMNENFGSSWIQNLNDTELSNYSYAMGLPTSVLKNIGMTMDEQKQAWEKAKYVDSQNFEVKKMLYTDELSRNRALEQYNYDLALQDRKDAFEWNKLNFQSQQEQNKALNKWSTIIGQDAVQYSNKAAAANSNGLYFNAAQPHPSANTAVSFLNPILAQAFPDNFKFKSSDAAGGLGGQCKWFCQKLTTLENGQTWSIGNTIQETKNNLNNFKKNGQAFDVGTQPIKVGQTIITSDSSTYGHAAVVNAITPDGKLVVSESNFKSPLTVSNNRVVDPNSDKILGVLKTVPKPQYQLQDKVLSALGGAVSTMLAQTPIPGLMSVVAKTMTAPADKLSPEQIINNNSFLTSVSKGSVKLTPTDESELLQTITPAYKQAYLQAKNTAEKALSPTNVMAIRQEIENQPSIKTGDAAINTYRNLNTAYKSYAEGKIGANTVDQSLITMFNKMLDPGSVVREGEYERTRTGQSALAAINGNLQKLYEGGAGIDDQTRQDMVSLAYELAQAQSEKMKKDLDQYKSYYVDQLGYQPFEILGVYNQYYQ